MDLKELFDHAENGTLTYEQFEAAATASKAKFADLSSGEYVSDAKYKDDIKAKDAQIATLQGDIAKRDTDLVDLRKQLEEAGTDATKLADITTKFNELQTKYNTETQNYQNMLNKQAYEFAVKEYANGKKFTSKAAKRDFVNSMISKQLQMENGKILGADDFTTAYSEDNDDAFVKEEQANNTKKPQFVSHTTPSSESEDDKDTFHFNFTGVRPHDAKK